MPATAKRILLIEDEDDIRDIAALSLETLVGWETLGASSGRAGVALAASQRPDAILLDVMMPEMDGPSTLESLQGNDATRDIPVIFMTAKVQTAELHRLARLGARGLISKPFDPLSLHSEVANVLGW